MAKIFCQRPKLMKIIFLWGYVKDIVYMTPVTNLDELKLRIIAATETVTAKFWRTLGGKLNTAWTFYVP
jgi:hypothetical protein